jgi:hypothetical protein
VAKAALVLLPLGAVVVLGIARLGAWMLVDDLEQRPACPDYPRRITAANVHLTPGLLEHQSWVEFATPTSLSGYFAVCLDGRVLEEGGGDFEFDAGVARISVSTSWVNALWLRGDLSAFQDVQRWQLRLHCEARAPC